MELNLETKQQLEKLLAKPALVTQEHIPLLQDLIKAYPYYQPLYLLLAKAGIGTENQHTFLTNAAMYNNGNILHQVIHEPKKLAALEDANVISYQAWPASREVVIEEVNTAIASSQISTEETQALNVPVNNTEPFVENLEPLKDEAIAWDEQSADLSSDEQENLAVAEQETEPDIEKQPFIVPEIENLEPLPNEVIAWEDEPADEQEKPAEAKAGVEAKPKPFVVPEIENLEPLPNEVIKVCEVEEINDESDKETSVESLVDESEKDEQETFEEIGELVVPEKHYNDTELVIEPTEAEETESEELELPEEVEEKHEVLDDITKTEEEPTPVTETINDDIAIESIASTDFFAFEKNFNAETISDEDKQPEEAPKITYQTSENIISKYDDDKLPFTFLWWLAKTRKDHEQIFRPYVSPVKSTAPTADLQQQYVEHIFHLQTPLDPITEQEQVSQQKAFSKENELIDTFIKNEPQLKVPKPDQINTENKAKKSAEDNYDLVSETLAEIYIEQMLYHKAIDTYQKLSLKFPEKSRYFADLIQSLEKKI